jgi:hypothetical protein
MLETLQDMFLCSVYRIGIVKLCEFALITMLTLAMQCKIKTSNTTINSTQVMLNVGNRLNIARGIVNRIIRIIYRSSGWGTKRSNETKASRFGPPFKDAVVVSMFVKV